MKIAIFSARQYDREFMNAANAEAGHALRFFEAGLTPEPDMPESAIASGCIDFILSPEEIAGEIVRIARAG